MAHVRILLAFLISTTLFSCGPSLYDVGIPANATVTSKSQIDRLKNDNYYMIVSFFTQPNKENPQPKPKYDSPANIDQIIENIGNINMEIGDYTSAQIILSRSVYDAYKLGDKIEVLYEKGNPEHAVVSK